MAQRLKSFSLIGIALGLFFSGVFTWLTPLPFFYAVRRYSFKFALMLLVFSLLCIGGIYFSFFEFLKVSASTTWLRVLEWFPAMIYYSVFGAKVVLKIIFTYFAFYAVLGLLLGWRINKKQSLSLLFAIVVLGTLGISSLFVLIFTQVNLSPFFQGIEQLLREALNQFLAANQNTGLAPEELVFISEHQVSIVRSFLSVLPALAIAFTLFLVWLNTAVAKRLFFGFGFFSEIEDFMLLRLPFGIVWFFIGVLSLYLLNIYVLERFWLTLVILNFVVVGAVVYFFQGLAILNFYLFVKRVSFFMRFLCYSLLVVFLQPLGLILVVLGFFDSWFNFRKLSGTSSAST